MASKRSANTLPTDKYLTVAEAAEMASVSPETVREWARKGELPTGRAGRLVRIKASDLQAYLERPPDGGPELTERDLEKRVSEMVREEASRCGGCGHLAKMHTSAGPCRAHKCKCEGWIGREE